MYGRFIQHYTWREIHELYRLTLGAPRNIEPRYNIAPTIAIDCSGKPIRVLGACNGRHRKRGRCFLVRGNISQSSGPEEID